MKQPTVVGPENEVSYRESVIRCEGTTFPFAVLSPVAQELVGPDGAEALVARTG